MAKQVGPLFFTGTIDGVVFYKLNGQYYMRSKGDYKSGKQMRKDPRLRRTLQNADQFGEASKLVKYWYYRQVPKAARKHGLYGKLTGMVNRWLQEGKTKDEAKALLIAYCHTLAIPAEQPVMHNDQRKATNEPPATQPRTTINDQRSTVPLRPKQARYLSKWKVKQDGLLYIPKEASQISSKQASDDDLRSKPNHCLKKDSSFPENNTHPD